MEPVFITFEGLDGSGKSSHLRRVADDLSAAGIDHVATKEPGGTPLADAIREVFLDPSWGTVEGGVELLLVFASRRQHLLECIEPSLQAGRVVLCDRFTDSTYAYQGAGRGVPLADIDAVDALATGRRRPDRTLLFDLPAELARSRGQSDARRSRSLADGGADRIDGESLDFYHRVRRGFLERAAEAPDRFRVIDSSGPVETTAAAVREALSDLVPGLADVAAPGGANASREGRS